MPNGFVQACILAYNQHHHLYIRPEDVWFAILSRLSFYINAHAEELRKFFVSHHGQEPLVVREIGTIDTVDFGPLATQMMHEIEKKVNDPELRTWIMPDFSTTTNNDRVTAVVLFMGAIQQYFTYTFDLCCGIPSVTVLSERADWERIRSRLDNIEQLGEEPAQFAVLLKIVLDFFVKTFNEPAHADVIDFWGRTAHEINNGSGPAWLSGWITAFCFWNDKGKRLNGPARSSLLESTSILSSLEDLAGPAAPQLQTRSSESETSKSSFRLDLDRFHTVDSEDIPNGYSSVPVTVDDNGTIYHTRMVAGSVGMQAWSSRQPIDISCGHNNGRSYNIGPDGEPILDSVQPQVGHQTGIDSIQPVSGWWMYEVSAAAEAEWKEIQDMEQSWTLMRQKKEKFRTEQETMERKSKLREILDMEKAKLELEATEKTVPAN